MKTSLRLAILFLASAAMFGCGRVPETAGPADATQSASPGAPMPSHAAYALEWVSNDIPKTMPAGKPATFKVSVKNTGDWVWNDPPTANPARPDGTYAVRLTHGWVGSDGKPLPSNSVRAELTAPVPPGQIANFSVKVQAPGTPGDYQLQIDLVEELVAFFSAKGNAKLSVPVTVQ